MTLHKDIRELNLLLAKLVDEGATPEITETIERLLTNRPELQDHYWNWMDLHVLLGVESQSLFEHRSSNATGKEPNSHVHLARPQSPGDRKLRNATRFSSSGYWAAITAALLILSALLLWDPSFSHDPTQSSKSRAPSEAYQPNDISSLASEGQNRWRIPHITNVKWTGPYFADSVDNDLVATEVRSGRVPLQMASGTAVTGYLLELKPGESVDLIATADAQSENNFSVTELDSSGTPIHRSVTFNNYTGSNSSERSRETGLLGSWSTYNDTDSPAYYLLAAVHKIADPPSPGEEQEDSRWHMSDMNVVVEEPDIVFLGWDDGGLGRKIKISSQTTTTTMSPSR